MLFMTSAARPVCPAPERGLAKGGEGGKALAETVLSILDDSAEVQYTYELDAPLTDKIEPSPRRSTARAA